jgi:serine/threonine protein kinase/Tol biopolymer transport system component
MSLVAGSRLGPYEIVAPLGAGGMGEVFRGRDTRLGRDVAIKILPAGFAQNEQFRARFEREAKTISSLNHPNICTLFDVGQAVIPTSEARRDLLTADSSPASRDRNDGSAVRHDGAAPAGGMTVHYLVMELIEGESLADRVQKGPLPLDQVLRYGSQVADALERAHKQGIVHRDLKPGNVMITKTGAKLLDFGLARPASESAVVHGMTEMPTQAKPLTQEGTILGTFQYMAPEQLEGAEADARTDIFSLGALLYEMATGKRAFEGSNRTSLIAAIVSSHPAPISSVAPMAPPALDHIVKKCLEKDPDDRWQSAHDVASELRWLSEAGSQAGVATTVTIRRKTREKIAWGVAALFAVVAAVALGWIIARTKGEAAARPFHASILYPPDVASIRGANGPITLSPDGTRLATVVSRKGVRFVSVYDFSTGKSTLLETTQDASFPFWSPDSRLIGFFAGGKLRRVDANGGAAQTLADAHDGRGGTWSEQGVIVFAPDIRGPLMKVSENGGAATAITKPAGDGITHRNPYFLPDGRRVLFIERQSRSDPFGRLMAGSIDGGAAKLVLDNASNVQFGDGRLLFARDRTLLAQRLDLETLKLEGAITPVAENLDYWNPRDLANFSTSRTGLLAFRHEFSSESTLAWFDRDGRLIETLVAPSQFSVAAVSRDLRQIAISRAESSSQAVDLWIVDAATKQTRRSTFTNTPSAIYGAFSSDGERLAVSSLTGVAGGGSKGGGWASSAVWLQPVTGLRTDKALLESTEFSVEDWSPDGKTLIGFSQRTGTSFDLTVVKLDDEKPQVRDFIKTPYDERQASFSPDGRWVIYSSDESGRSEVYLVDFPGATRKFQISRDGGGVATWRSDGREVYFSQPGGAIMAAAVTLGETVEIGTPVRLGLSDARTSAPHASDGKRFLVEQENARDSDPPVQVIRDWAAGLPK